MAKVKLIKLPEHITIEVNDRVKTVNTESYVKAKTRELREFGYPTLSVDTVRQQLSLVIAGKKPGVIGMFMQNEVVEEA